MICPITKPLIEKYLLDTLSKDKYLNLFDIERHIKEHYPAMAIGLSQISLYQLLGKLEDQKLVIHDLKDGEPLWMKSPTAA